MITYLQSAVISYQVVYSVLNKTKEEYIKSQITAGETQTSAKLCNMFAAEANSDTLIESIHVE